MPHRLVLSIVRPLVAAAMFITVSACSMQYTGNSAGAGDSALAAADNDEGIECKREQVLGTRMTKRICSTRAQREAREEASRRAVDTVTRKALGHLETE